MLPADFVKFRDQREKSKENESNKKIKGYKKGKDVEHAKLMKLKYSLKMKRTLKGVNSKYLKRVKGSLKKFTKSRSKK